MENKMRHFYQDQRPYSERTAIITEKQEKITYSRLLREADQLAGRMESRRLVFLICGNTLESVTGYLGFLRKRAVPVLIHEAINRDLFSRLREKYRPACFYGSREILSGFGITEEGGYTECGCFRSYCLFRDAGSPDYPIFEELALLLTTSGSTGSPKLVRQSYENINSNAASIAQYLDIRETDRAIMTMPMSYTYGLSIINSHLLCGASIIMTGNTLMDREFWRLLKEEEATNFGGVPYIYEMLKKLRFERMELPSLRYLTQAGGRLSRELTEEFYRLCGEKGIRLIVMYGQTEATARMSYLPWERAEGKAGSIGVAIPGGRFYLADEERRPVERPGETGELVYEGPNVTLGYAQGYEDLKKGDERRGVLYTGDMARRDEEGFYYIVGRKKRFLKIFGNRVNLDETESLLKKKGFECVCAGTDELMKIYTTGKEENGILDYISHELHLSKSAFQVIPIREIPRNEAGKVLYGSLPQ